MKRSVSPPARVASSGMALALAVAGIACAPDQSVEPGAPELINYVILQAGGATIKIPPSTPDCPDSPAGAVCNPSEPVLDGMCRDVMAGHWCNCIPDMGTPPDPPPGTGTWNCDPFGSVVAVFAVFDRLLDTAPLDPGDEAGLPDITTVTATGGVDVPVLTDYSPNGTPKALILLFFSLRWEGPSLFSLPDAGAFPSNTGLTVALNPQKVLAKDGTTPFSGTGALPDGRLLFLTAPFSAAVVPPDPASGDANTFTVAFTNLVDATAVTPHITATVNGAPAAITVSQVSESAVAVAPEMPWPPGSTVVVSVDGTAVDLLGATVAAPVASDPYMPPAMP